MYVGNNPNSRETLTIRPGWQWQQLIEQPMREGFGGREEEYFRRRVRQYLQSDPAGFAAGIGRKTLQFVSSREIPRNIDPYLFSRWSVVLSVLNPKVGSFGFAFGLLLPLALLGLMARWREVPGPVWLLLLAYPAAVITVFVAGRYRVPIVPVAVVMAAAGGGFIIQTARRRCNQRQIDFQLGGNHFRTRRRKNPSPCRPRCSDCFFFLSFDCASLNLSPTSRSNSSRLQQVYIIL